MRLIEALTNIGLWLSFKNAQITLLKEQLTATLSGESIALIEHDGGHSYAVAVVISDGLVWGVAQRMAVDIKAGQELHQLWRMAKGAA